MVDHPQLIDKGCSLPKWKKKFRRNLWSPIVLNDLPLELYPLKRTFIVISLLDSDNVSIYRMSIMFKFLLCPELIIRNDMETPIVNWRRPDTPLPQQPLYGYPPFPPWVLPIYPSPQKSRGIPYRSMTELYNGWQRTRWGRYGAKYLIPIYCLPM